VSRATWLRIGRALWIALRTGGMALFAAAAWLVALLTRRRDGAPAPARPIEVAAPPRASGSSAEDRDPIVTGPTFETVPAEEPALPPGKKRTKEAIVAPPPKKPPPGKLEEERRQKKLSLEPGTYELPPIDVLQKGPRQPT